MDEKDHRSEARVSPELAECITAFRSTLGEHVSLINKIIAVTVNHPSVSSFRLEKELVDPGIASALAPMLQAVGSSSSTLISLSETAGLHTRDCYSIARSIIEASINICFILAEGPPAASKAMRHAHQKAYRDLERQSIIDKSIIQLAFSGKPDPESIDDLDSELQEFTSARGREKGWTDLSVDARIAEAGKRLGHSVLNSLHMARFAVYRHSSEVLHGTLFSALYFLGTTSPRESHRSFEEFCENIGQQHMLILLAGVLALSATVEAFHRKYGFADVYNDSRNLIAKLRKIPYLDLGTEATV